MDIRLTSYSIIADNAAHQQIRVRAGKGKKGSKRGTKAPLTQFARAEFIYSQGKQAGKVKNNGFKQFGQRLTKVESEVPNDKGTKLVKRQVLSIKPSLFIEPNRKVKQIKTIGEANRTMIETVNNLLRNVLLFKGYNFAALYERYKTQPDKLTFNVGTEIELLYKQDKTKPINEQEKFSLYIPNITVRKVFKDVKTDSEGKVIEINYSILFCSKTCQPVNNWLKNLHFFELFL